MPRPKKPSPIHILIKCRDCKAGRYIKPQDKFQVKRCEDCQKEHRNAKRRAA